jgi:hypothetical protein
VAKNDKIMRLSYQATAQEGGDEGGDIFFAVPNSNNTQALEAKKVSSPLDRSKEGGDRSKMTPFFAYNT